jgi:ADP-heptose:LPS heptosyltransferase
MNLPFVDALLYGYVARRAKGGAPSFNAAELPGIRRILLMLTTGLGDAVLSTPVFPALRAALPNADIRLFCRSAWAPLFAADPNLKEVIPYHGKYRRFFPTIERLRAFAPELAVILHGNDPDIVPLAYLAGSRYIIRVPTRGTRYGFLLANRKREQDASILPGIHYVENRLRVLETVGVAAAGATPTIHLDQRTRDAATGKLAAHLKGAPFWVLHANAADPYKSWPGEKMREFLILARRAYPRHAAILTGTTDDRVALNGIARELDGVHVMAGEFDIAGTAAVLAGAHCVIAPDTGILHLAAALDRPVVGLYAPTFAALTGPRALSATPIVIQKPRTCDPCVEKKCPFTPRNCMDQIGAEEVLAALSRQLDTA